MVKFNCYWCNTMKNRVQLQPAADIVTLMELLCLRYNACHNTRYRMHCTQLGTC